METFELYKDGITFKIKCTEQLIIEANTNSEQWRLVLGDSDVAAASGNAVLNVSNGFKLLKHALLARSGTHFVKLTVTRQEASLVLTISGPVLPSNGKCIFIVPPAGKDQSAPSVSQTRPYPQVAKTGSTWQMPTLSTRSPSVQTPTLPTTRAAFAANSAAPQHPQQQTQIPDSSIPPSTYSQPPSSIDTTAVATAVATPHNEQRKTVLIIKKNNIVDVYKTFRKDDGSQLPGLFAGDPSANRSTTETRKNLPLQHIMVDLKQLQVSTPIGTDSLELHVTVFNSTMDQQLFEDFIIPLTHDGRAIFGSRSLRTVFQDLPCRVSDLYLVLKLYRKATFAERPSKDSLYVRRAHACGIAHLAFLDSVEQESQITIPMYYSPDENEFWNLPNHIKSHNANYVKQLPGSKGATIGISLLRGPLVLGFDETVTSSFSYHRLEQNDQPRNDLYICLKEASFPGKKPYALEVSMKVIASSTQPALQFLRGTGRATEDTSYSFVIPSQNSPHWEETFCIKLPPDVQRIAHSGGAQLQCTVSAISKKGNSKTEISRGTIKLVDPTWGLISDGVHTIQCTSVKPQGFAKAMAGARQKEGRNGSVKIRVFLVSSDIIRSVDLKGLSQWRTISMSTLLDTIRSVPSALEEIPKFMGEVIDNLTAVADNFDIDEVQTAVVSTLGFIFGQLCEKKENKAIFETYLSQQFKGFRCGPKLMESFSLLVKDPTRPAQETVYLLNSLDLFLKMIVRAYQLSTKDFTIASSTPPISSASMQHLIDCMNFIATTQEPRLVLAQMALLTKLPSVYSYMVDSLGKETAARCLAYIISNFFWQNGAVQTASYPVHLASHNINHVATALMNFVGSLLKPGGCNALYVPETYPIVWEAILNICTSFLRAAAQDGLADIELKCFFGNVLLQLVSFTEKSSSPRLLVESLRPLMPYVLQIVLRTKDETVRLDGVVFILSQFYLLPMAEVAKFIASPGLSVDPATFINYIVQLIGMLVLSPMGTIFPIQWSPMLWFQYRAVYRLLVSVGGIILSSRTMVNAINAGTLPPLLRDLLKLGMSFVNAGLPLPTNSEIAAISGKQPKRGVTDMQNEALKMLVDAWNLLGKLRLQMASDLVDPILRCSLSDNSNVSSKAALMYHALLAQDFETNGSIALIRTLTIRTVIQSYSMLAVRKPSPNTKELLAQWFNNLVFPPGNEVSSVVSPTIKRGLVDDIVQLMELVDDIESLPVEGDSHERITRTVNLMHHLEYLREMDGYLRTVHRLVQLHLRELRPAEAAQCLLLHIHELSFDDTIQEPFLDFPRQTSAERKVSLLRLAMEHFSSAHMYEEAYQLGKQLAKFLEKRFLYNELMDVLRLQAEYLKKIMDPQRLYPTYFLIIFNGEGIPSFLKGKCFVMRYCNGIQLQQINQSLRLEFPQTQVVNSILPPTDASASKCIQVVQCEPYPEDSQEELVEPDVNIPEHVKRFWTHKLLRRFTYSQQGVDMLAVYEIITSGTFPTILSRLPVESIRIIETKPLQNAHYAVNTGAAQQPPEVVSPHVSGINSPAPAYQTISPVFQPSYTQPPAL